MGWAAQNPEKPQILYDFEFHFVSGQSQFFSAVDGRDKIAADEARVRLELHPDEQTVEEVIIHRNTLACMKTTKRTIPADMRTEGLKLVDPQPA